MENKEMKNPMLNELEDDVLGHVSGGMDDNALAQVRGGISDAEDNLETEYVKEETMIIIPLI